VAVPNFKIASPSRNDFKIIFDLHCPVPNIGALVPGRDGAQRCAGVFLSRIAFVILLDMRAPRWLRAQKNKRIRQRIMLVISANDVQYNDNPPSAREA
jgi:hypothetical protein